MCGIVGIMGNPSGEQDKVFQELLAVDVIRGAHSTGVAFVKKKKVQVLKGVGVPHDLFATSEFARAISEPNYCLIGHNRYATKGAITGENAHPFQSGDITMVHNGTLWSTYNLPDQEEFKDMPDSAAICHSINKIGIDETWKKLNGAAALVWFDKKDKTLNILRNDKRDIWFAMMEKDAGLVLASESMAIAWITSRNKIKIKDKGYFNPKPNVLFSFKWDGQKVTYKSRVLEEYKYVYVQDTNVTHIYRGSDRGFWGRVASDYDWDERGYPTYGEHSALDQRAKSVNSKDEAEDMLLEWLCKSDAKRKDITEEQFYERYKTCTDCGCSLSGQYVEAVIVDEKHAFCFSCAEVAANMDVDITKVQSGA